MICKHQETEAKQNQQWPPEIRVLISMGMNSEYHDRSSLREKEEDVYHKSEKCVDLSVT